MTLQYVAADAWERLATGQPPGRAATLLPFARLQFLALSRIGHYFVLTGRSPFSRLVYPVPHAGGLGIHLTLDLAGHARFGPDIQWVDGVDYQFDAARESKFVEAVRRYFPRLQAQSIASGYTGIRPKLGPAGSGPQDFIVQGPESHGIPGLVNLYGIESPGLTAALALAEHVRRLIG